MFTYKITLKSDLNHGTFYWVTNINAQCEEEAVTAAEHLFLEQIGASNQWDISDYEAVKL